MKNNLTSNPTWQVIDSSKVQDFMVCPRMYFFKYILGWKIDTANLNLVFGEAWHRAMETLLKLYELEGGYYSRAVETAIDNDLTPYYRESFGEQFDLTTPKNPGNALVAMKRYIEQYQTDRFKVLHTEVAGSVLINSSPERNISFRMDAVVEEDNKITVFEHKTSGILYGFWADQWQTMPQIGTYLHAAYTYYGDKVKQLIVNGSFFRKKGNEHVRVPILRSAERLNAWLYMMNYWFEQIERQMDQLAKDSEDDQIMQSFPMCGKSCIQYMKPCIYQDFCIAWPNPLARCSELPQDWKVEFWNPLERHEKKEVAA